MTPEALLKLIPEKNITAYDEQHSAWKKVGYERAREEIANHLAPKVCLLPSRESIIKAIVDFCKVDEKYEVTDFEKGLADAILKELKGEG